MADDGEATEPVQQVRAVGGAATQDLVARQIATEDVRAAVELEFAIPPAERRDAHRVERRHALEAQIDRRALSGAQFDDALRQRVAEPPRDEHLRAGRKSAQDESAARVTRRATTRVAHTQLHAGDRLVGRARHPSGQRRRAREQQAAGRRVDAFRRGRPFCLGERGADCCVRRQRDVGASRLTGHDTDFARANRELQGVEQRAAHLQQISPLGERVYAIAAQRVRLRRARRHRLRLEPRQGDGDVARRPALLARVRDSLHAGERHLLRTERRRVEQHQGGGQSRRNAPRETPRLARRAHRHPMARRRAWRPAATTPTHAPVATRATPAYERYRARSAASSAPGGPGLVRL